MILTYSYFVFHLYATKCPLIHENLTTWKIIDQKLPITEMPLYLELVWYCLFIMIFIFLTKELLQLFSSPRSYFKIVENHIQLVFIILALITILPDPFGPINLRGDLCNCLNRWKYAHYSTAAVSIKDLHRPLYGFCVIFMIVGQRCGGLVFYLASYWKTTQARVIRTNVFQSKILLIFKSLKI